MEGKNTLGSLKTKREWFPLGEAKARTLLLSIIPRIRKAVRGEEPPSVTAIARKTRSPFRVLVSTVISARTKDEVTSAVSKRLFSRAPTPESIASLTEEQIAGLIFPAGFYRTKAKALIALSKRIMDDFGGKVPDTMDDLLGLPGVGRKTANLVLTNGFGKPGICVDTHVHRVSNRLGVVRTKNPEETEFALRRVLPQKHWIEINDLLVTFGRLVCTPVSPHCSRCIVKGCCLSVGVGKRR
ncbi:MAG: endonuclease III [Candidatus Krumholzibacteria bacterium]|nr:endonuclease III [Candidatus Krumholzibacteria bacterium]